VDWIFDNIQVIVALAAAAAYWLTNMKAAKEAREAESEAEWEPSEEDFNHESDHRDHHAPAEMDPPRAGSRPPLVTRPASAPPPLERALEAELNRQQAMMERLEQLKQQRASEVSPILDKGKNGRIAGAAKPARSIQAAPRARTTPSTAIGSAGASHRLRSSLHHRATLRHAVVLREIIGPPKAFRK
jgi:hypothetical protein